MQKIDFDGETKLYCYYNSECQTYTDFTTTPEKLIDDTETLYDEVDIIEIDLTFYYLDKLKTIVKSDMSCGYNRTELFNLTAKYLMNYGNEQVLNMNYPMWKYIDIFKTIIKLKEMI